MERQLRILLLEDSSTDAELMLIELRRAGVAHVSQCVASLEDFLAALPQFNPDLVLSDQRLPGFTGTEALVLARQQRPDLPFILVTGALGEEVAVETIKSGATDYILKHRLFQLAPAVLRAVRETEQRTQRRQAEESLKIQHQQLKLQNQLLQQIQRQLSASQERYSRLYDTAPIGYTSLNEKGIICEINATAARMLGLLRAQLIGMPFSQFVSRNDLNNLVAHMQQCTDSEVPVRSELTLTTAKKQQPMVELLTVRTQDLRLRIFYQTTITDITERKHAEQILRQSEERFRQLAENIHEVFWMTDPRKNQMIYVSPGYETIWERSCASLYASPMNWIEAIHPEDRERVVEAAFTKQTSGQYDEVYRIVRPDGSIRWIEDRAFPIRDGSGNVYRIAGLAEDITNHKRAEQAARESEARKSAIMESALDGILTIDHAGRITEFNSAAERIFGHPRADVIGKEMASILIPASSRERHRQGLARYLSNGESRVLGKRIEMTALRADGTEFPVELTITREEIEGPPIFTGFVRDISEQKLAEQRLAAEHSVIRALAESATLAEGAAKILQSVCESLGWEAGAIWELERADDLLHCIDVWCSPALKGQEFATATRSRTFRAGEGLPGRVWSSGKAAWIPDALADPNFPRGPIAARCGLHGAFGFPILLRNQIIGVIEFFSRQIREPDGVLLEMMSALGGQIGQFIARKQAEEAAATLGCAIESTTEAICITGLNDRFNFVNRAFQEIYGYTESEILGKTPEILFSPKNPPPLMAEILEQTRLGGWRGELIDKRKDGTEFPVFLSTSQVKDRSGRVIGLMGVAQDITERKRTEKQTAAFSVLGYRLSAAAAPQEAAQIILDVASELFGWDAGYVHLYSPSEDKLVRILTVDTVDGQRVPVLETTFTPDPSPLMRLIMKEGGRLISRSNEPSVSAKLVPFGDSSRPSACMMYVPIHTSGTVLGILSIQSYTPSAYSQNDLTVLQALADYCGDALQRIKVAEALRQAEAKYRSIFENATEGIFRTTSDGRYFSANPALARMFGYQSPEELIASITDIERQTYVLPQSRQELKSLLETQGSVEGFEAERFRKDGSKFWITINGHAVRDAKGCVLYYEGTNQDITERKRAESVLRESEEKFRTLFESAPIGIALHDARGRYVHTNQAYQQMLGYADEELRRLGTRRLTHPDDVAEGQRLFGELCNGSRERYQREKRYFHKDGHLVWAQSSASAIRKGSGELNYIISMVEDISQRKSVVEALRQSERKLRLIAENTTDVIFAFDMARQPVYINPAVKELTGYAFAEIQEKRFINWIHQDDRERMLKHWEELYLGRSHADVEFRLITKTGQMKWCSSTWGPLLDENDRQIGVQGRERDITELKRAEVRTRELAAIVENSEDAIIGETLDGTIISWNRGAERIYGYAAEEALGQPISMLLPPNREDEMTGILQDISQGKKVDNYETLRCRKDGTLVELSLTISPIKDASGKVTGASAIGRDISQRKQLEQEVLESSANERRRIGHELHDGLGQYLAGIAFRAKALEQTLASEAVPHASEAKELATLVSNAISQTRSLARGLDPVEVETIGLPAALQNLSADTEKFFNIACLFRCSDSTANVDPHAALALYRIAQEAIHNAITHGDARRIEIELATETGQIRLRIQDNGQGFEVDSRKQTGMGLRVMEYRARSIGAKLKISSRRNQGTEIQCLIPPLRAVSVPAPGNGE